MGSFYFLARPRRFGKSLLLDTIKQVLLFSSIPHVLYRNNPMSQYEGFYCSIVYSYLLALAYDILAEDLTQKRQIDLILKMPNKIVILEFKIGDSASAKRALTQIKQKNYAQKYQAKKTNLSHWYQF